LKGFTLPTVSEREVDDRFVAVSTRDDPAENEMRKIWQ
jgi:hypothetical protein